MIPVYVAPRKREGDTSLGYASPFLIYNTGATMIRCKRLAAFALLVLALTACAGPLKKPLVDPFPLRFPLVEVGALEIEGRVVGQPHARDGVLTFATDDGFLAAVVVSSRAVLWRRAGAADGGGSAVTSPPDASKGPTVRSNGAHLQAFDGENGSIWEFMADSRIVAEPAVSSGRVYFGTENRRFYCLKAATGKVLWSRRLQGAPLQPAVARGGTVAVAASNSVVYFLSRKGGSILSWANVPSRIIFPLALSGQTLLVSSASPDVAGLDMATGRTVGGYSAAGPLAAGAVWAPPFVVLFVEDDESGRQRLLFLRSR